MSRIAITSIIFIVLACGASANTTQAAQRPSHLGVGTCSMSHIETVKSFIRRYIFESDSEENHIYYNDCNFEVAPHDDRHDYTVSVTLNGDVTCELSIATGHHDVTDVLDLESETTRQLIEKCKTKFDEAHPRNMDALFSDIPLKKNHNFSHRINDLSGLSDLYDGDDEGTDSITRSFRRKNSVNDPDFDGLSDMYNGDDEGTDSITRSFRRKNSVNDPDFDGLGELLHENDDGYTSPTPRVFGNHSEFDGLSNMFNHTEDGYVNAPNRSFRRKNGENLDGLSGFFGDDEDSTQEYGFNDQSESILGGYKKCDADAERMAFGLLVALSNKRIVKGVYTYTENMISCQTQVVAGLNVDITLSFDGYKCRMEIYQLQNQNETILELTNADELYADEHCAGYLHPELVETLKNKKTNLLGSQ